MRFESLLKFEYKGCFWCNATEFTQKKFNNFHISLLNGKSSIWKNLKSCWYMMQMNIFTMKLKLPKCNTVTPCPFCNHQKAKTIRHFVVRGFFQSSRKSYKESAFLLCHDSTLKNVINCGNSKNYKCMSHLGLSKQNQFSLIFLSYGPEHVYSLYHTEF